MVLSLRIELSCNQYINDSTNSIIILNFYHLASEHNCRTQYRLHHTYKEPVVDVYLLCQTSENTKMF